MLASVQSHAHGEMQKRPWYIEQLDQQIDRICKWLDRGGQLHRQRAQIHWWINNTAWVNRHKFTAQEQRNSLSNRFPFSDHTRFSFTSFCSLVHSSLLSVIFRFVNVYSIYFLPVFPSPSPYHISLRFGWRRNSSCWLLSWYPPISLFYPTYLSFLTLYAF